MYSITKNRTRVYWRYLMDIFLTDRVLDKVEKLSNFKYNNSFVFIEQLILYHNSFIIYIYHCIETNEHYKWFCKIEDDIKEWKMEITNVD